MHPPFLFHVQWDIIGIWDGSGHPLLPKFREKHPVTSHDLGHHPGPAEVKALRAEPQAEPWWEAWWFRSSKPVQGSVEAGMSRMRSKGSFFTLGGLGVEVVFASRRAAVRKRPPLFVWVPVAVPKRKGVLQKWSLLEVSNVAQPRFVWQACNFVTSRQSRSV